MSCRQNILHCRQNQSCHTLLLDVEFVCDLAFFCHCECCQMCWCRALEVWYTDKGFWDTLTQRVMQQDWSWAEPALDYLEMYYKALKGI